MNYVGNHQTNSNDKKSVQMSTLKCYWSESEYLFEYDEL